MIPRRVIALVVAPLLIFLTTTLCAAGDKTSGDNNTQNGAVPKLDSAGRVSIIRGLEAELGYARRTFPMGKAGITIKDGRIIEQAKLENYVASWGPSLKPGDQARITQVIFRDKSIIFELNGGPQRKKKWYEHIEIDAMGGAYSPAQNAPPENLNVHGTFVQLAFDKYVPNLTGEQVKKMLDPVLNFSAKSASEAYLDTVPPKAKAAITNHQVLVGMDHDMVLMAKGRPGQKVREKDPISGDEFEEWIYGQPPQEVQFVRFDGDQVVRLEVMQVNGQKLVKTQKEIDIKKPTVDVAQQNGTPQVVPVNKPSLRRPGEDTSDENTNVPLSPPTSRTPQQVPTSSPGGPDDPNAGGGRPSPVPNAGGPGVDYPVPPSQTNPPPGYPPVTPQTTKVPDNNGPAPGSGPN